MFKEVLGVLTVSDCWLYLKTMIKIKYVNNEQVFLFLIW